MRFRALGPLTVTTAAGPSDLGVYKVARTLAVLLAARGEVVSAGRLIEAVWAGEPPPNARVQLQGYVSSLRKTLDDADGALLATSGDGYRLDPGPDDFDVLRYEDLVAAARHAIRRGSPGRAARLLDAGAALWYGGPYQGLEDLDLVDHEVRRLDATKAEAEELWARAQLYLGRHHELRLTLERLAETSLREELWRLLMVALYRCGDQAAALRAGQRYRRRLRDEEGVEPGAQLRRTEDAILAQDPALDPPQRPEVGNRRRPVPAETGPLIGRGGEVTALWSVVRTHRISTIAGPSGVGKSRLARNIAHEAGFRFADGVGWVSLSPIESPDQVDAALAEALGVPGRPGVGRGAALDDFGWDAELLVVLDNCEHVVAAVAELVGRLAEVWPDAAFLCTSQVPLGLPSERVFRLAPLDPGAAVELLRNRLPEDGAIHHDDDLAEICRRVDGLPLAIELVAPHVAALSGPATLARIDGLELRADDSGLARAHHRSLYDTVAWSYGLLSKEEQELLRALSVFGGDATLEALESVGGAPVGAAAGGLVTKSLVTTVDADGHRRFGLLDFVRRFAAAECATGEWSRHCAAHLAWYAEFARRAGRELMTEPGPALAAFTSEEADLRIALERAVAGGRSAAAAGLVSAQGLAWMLTGQLRTARGAAAAVLGMDPAPAGADLAAVSYAAGMTAALDADYGAAVAHLGRARELYEQLGRLRRLAWVDFWLARTASVRYFVGIGDADSLADAAARYATAIETFAAHDDVLGLGFASSFAAWNARMLGADGPPAGDVAPFVAGFGPPQVTAVVRGMAAVELADAGDLAGARNLIDGAAAELLALGDYLNAQISAAFAAVFALRASHDDALAVARDAIRLQLRYGNEEWLVLTVGLAWMAASAAGATSLAGEVASHADRRWPAWLRTMELGGAGRLHPVRAEPGAPVRATADILDAVLALLPI